MQDAATSIDDFNSLAWADHYAKELLHRLATLKDCTPEQIHAAFWRQVADARPDLVDRTRRRVVALVTPPE